MAPPLEAVPLIRGLQIAGMAAGVGLTIGLAVAAVQLDRDSGNPQAYEAWRDLSARFERDLAGRYPFGVLFARDVSPATVKAFFTDYDAQRAALRQMISGLSGTQSTEALRFLDQLDAVSAFFNGSLTGTNPSQAVRLSIVFRAHPGGSRGSEQVVSWSLTSGAKSAGYPNRPNSLDWHYGQALLFDLVWADRSPWRPTPDLQQSNMHVRGAAASFVAYGDWALLRMIDMHRPKSVGTTDPLDPSRILLEFTVPITRTESPPDKTLAETARFYISFDLSKVDPKTRAWSVPALLPTFPHSAPRVKYSQAESVTYSALARSQP